MGGDRQHIEERFKKLLRDASHCTLATASADGEPEAAEMACVAAPGEGLYLYTLSDSRKYSNLRENPRAAMAVFDPPEYAQLDGTMEELAGEDAQAAHDAMLEQSSADLSGYHDDPRCRYFYFRPTRVSLRVDQGYPSQYETWDVQQETEPRRQEL